MSRTAPLIGLALIGAVAGAGFAEDGTDANGRVCGDAIRDEESRRTYPGDLLISIALVESGRYDRTQGLKVPWPWTVTAAGRGRFFATKAAAAAKIRSLRAAGIESIDVGCMQVNLHYHAQAFDTVEDALDPTQNVAYAASFLTDLALRTGSWFAAVGRYHSGTAEHAKRYRTKVLAQRDARRRGGHDELRRLGRPPVEHEVLTDSEHPPAAPGLPTVLRGSAGPRSPARVFAPGRVVLPIILRGARHADPDGGARR